MKSKKVAYEVESHFIGQPEYYYFETRAEAEKAAAEINGSEPERAWWGLVFSRAYINEIPLADDQHIEGGEIVTERKKRYFINDKEVSQEAAEAQNKRNDEIMQIEDPETWLKAAQGLEFIVTI